MTSPTTTSIQDSTTAHGEHAGAKAGGTLSLSIGAPKGTLHNRSSKFLV
jgi:hypothetical protein